MTFFIKTLAVNVGDEGGFAPNVSGAEESLDLLTEAIKKAGYEGKIKIGFDAAASEFIKDDKYDLDFKNPDSASAVILLLFCLWLFTQLLLALRELLLPGAPLRRERGQ